MTFIKNSPEEKQDLSSRMPTERRDKVWALEMELKNSPSYLERQGWKEWLTKLGPKTFTGEFASFHADFWDWYWPLLKAKQTQKPLSSVSNHLVYLLTLGRGMGKSSSVEWAVIAAGALLQEAVVLYVSSTAGLAVDHLNSIRDRIESAEVAKYYSKLAHPRVGKHGNRYGWRSDLLGTDSGLTVFAVGLEEEVRGLKVGDARPALIVLDDIDSKRDSPDIVKKKEQIIAGSILPTGTANTIVLLAQNLIHANSVATRIYRKHSELLSYRRESGLVKSFTDDFEVADVDGRWMVKQGRPVWKYFDMGAVQAFLDKSGPTESYAEYQHEFERNRQGLVIPNYDDEKMVMAWSEFKDIFGQESIPASWNKYVGHDFARTKTQEHANVVVKVTVSSQNTKLPGHIFIYDAMSFEAGTEADDVALRLLKSMDSRDWDEIVASILSREHLEKYLKSATELISMRRDVLARVIPPMVSKIISQENYRVFRGSHEQAQAALKVYKTVYGLPFQPANPGKEGGLDLFNYYVKQGRVHIIVPNNKKHFPTEIRPELLHDSDLLRHQFTHWRYLEPKLTPSGIEEKGPEKLNDDFGNCTQFLFMDNIVQARPLTRDEKVQTLIPDKYKRETLKTGYSASHEVSVNFQEARAKSMIKSDVRQWDWTGAEIGIDEELS